MHRPSIKAPEPPSSRRHLSRAAGLLLSVFAAGCANSSTDLVLDNDVFGFGRQADRNYTNGMELRGTYDQPQAPRLLRAIGEALELIPVVHDDWAAPTATLGWSIGHEMYTPTDLTSQAVILDDRPYAGWLYTTFLLAEEANNPGDPQRDYVIGRQLEIGIIGPASMAEPVQKRYHKEIDSTYPQGWHNQLDNELGIVISLWARDRGLFLESGDVPLLGWTKCEMDTVSTMGVSLGNVRTEVYGGNDVRIGWNLTRELGPYARDVGFGSARLGGSAANMTDDTHDFGIHVFAGVDGRGVARNIFLDGNSFEDSHSVTREPFVADIHVGLAARFKLGGGWLNLSYTYVHRTPEFREREEAHIFGTFRIWYQ